LKKRTKKLLSPALGTNVAVLTSPPDAMSKGFLLLFFKKEVLPSSDIASYGRAGE
jgi:hypothetical protein